ncbi:Bilin biosynthesis protein cpeY [Synechococcus sp. CC9311]|nr:Bilin biosynthesis protein cpeY [Synechococcus sp. CC9311]
MHTSARFDNIHPGLTCEHARQLLMKSVNEQESESDFYTAAAHLINCPCEETQKALIEFLQYRDSSCQSVKITKRKIVEVLARLGCIDAIPAIGKCLWSDDIYLVENTVWSLQTLKCQDRVFVDKIIDILEADVANQRIIIQFLASMGISSSVDIIRSFQSNSIPGIKGAAISAIAKLTHDCERVPEISSNLLLPNQMDRHSAIQDLIDANAVDQIAEIFSAPVSPVFKLRAVRKLYDENLAESVDSCLLSSLDSLLSCDLSSINCVHRYDEVPSCEYLIRDLYNTDFSRCYLALEHLSSHSASEIFPLLKNSWIEEANNDYGAHYCFICLFGSIPVWPGEFEPWIIDILVSSIFNIRPQFQKSRAASVLSLAKLHPGILDECMEEILATRGSLPWDMRYSLIQAMDHYTDLDMASKSKMILEISDDDKDLFVQARARMALGL